MMIKHMCKQKYWSNTWVTDLVRGVPIYLVRFGGRRGVSRGSATKIHRMSRVFLRMKIFDEQIHENSHHSHDVDVPKEKGRGDRVRQKMCW